MPLTAIPLVSKLSKNVIRVLGCNPSPMTLQGTNTYLVGTGNRRVLIDAGDEHSAPTYTKLLDKVLQDENATVEHLIITHWHHDHIGGIGPVKNLVSSKNGSELAIWKLPRSQCDEDAKEEEEKRKSEKSWRLLDDEQSLEVEGAKLRVKYTPGHTTDHACLLLAEENALFSGDCVLGEGTAVFEDLHDYLHSLTKILNMRLKIIYPGHGPIIEKPSDKIKFYIEHRMKREAQLLEVFAECENAKGLSEMDIVGRVYKDTPKDLWPAAAVNVGHHLEKLLKEEKVKYESGLWYQNSG